MMPWGIQPPWYRDNVIMQTAFNLFAMEEIEKEEEAANHPAEEKLDDE